MTLERFRTLAPGEAPPAQSPVQLRYAQVLVWGTRAGLAMLVIGFASYLLGWIPASVPADRLPQLWGLPLAQYMAHTHGPRGWAWLAQLPQSDFISLAGVAVLAGCSVLSLLSVVPLYLAQRDRAFVLVCLADAAVVVMAASGWLTGGH